MSNPTSAPAPVKDDSKDAAQNGGISLLEWIVALLGLCIVLGALGFLVLRAGQDRGLPPSLRMAVEAVTPVRGGFVAEISVANEGDKTAAAVTIIGQLMDGETMVEERELTLDYVPPKSRRLGGLFFSHDPADYALVLEPVGYQQP